MTATDPDSQGHVRGAHVKPRSGGRSQVGAGTREIRRMSIGRELCSDGR